MRRFGQMLAAAAMIGLGGVALAEEPAIKDQGDRISGAPQATAPKRARLIMRSPKPERVYSAKISRPVAASSSAKRAGAGMFAMPS